MLQIQDLRALNATLNAISAVLLLTGYVFIRMRRPIAHRNVMIAALVSSAFFLTSYLIYHAHVGSKHFPGTGAARPIYFTISSRTRFSRRRCPSSPGITVCGRGASASTGTCGSPAGPLPIWLYVSVTGVVVYWMLYQMTW